MVRRTVLRSAFAFAATLLLSATAQAQLFRAYLASDGSDANACILSAPCRLLPAALAAVADGGEIWMLDSANYNAATVTVGKSVSILAVPGAVGSVVAIGGPAISITASGLKVALRNLVVVPFPGGGGTNGVDMTGASTLTIEHSVIANLPSNAVRVVGAGKLKIANTIIRNNGLLPVRLENGVTAEISGTQMLANGAGGLWAIGSIATTATTATVSDSVVSGGNVAIYAFTSITGADVRIVVTRCTIDAASIALNSETTGVGTASLSVSNSTIANNISAWNQNGTGSVIRTLGNNHITDNIGAPVGSLTTVPLQ